MEIQLNSSDVKLKVKIGEQSYDLKKPTVGQLKLIEAERVKGSGGNMLAVMETIITSMGLPQPIFDDLGIDQLEQLMNGIGQLITPKKN